MQSGFVFPANHSVMGQAEHAVVRHRRPSLEEIRAFILDWYRCIDERAPVSVLITRLAKTDLELEFPDQTIHSAAAFRDWYVKWCLQGLTTRHEMRELQIYWDKASGFGADCIVNQRLSEPNGKTKSELLKSSWHFRHTALGAVEVTRCVVTRVM